MNKLVYQLARTRISDCIKRRIDAFVANTSQNRIIRVYIVLEDWKIIGKNITRYIRKREKTDSIIFEKNGKL